MFDIILILIILFTIWRGWKRGAIMTLLKLFSYILALVIVFFARNPITDFAMNTGLAGFVRSNLVKENADLPKLPFVGDIVTSMAEGAVRIIVMFIAMAIVFIIILVLFHLLLRLLNRVLAFLKIGGVDKFLGAILAVFPAYIVAYVAILLTTATSPISAWAHHAVETSTLMAVIPTPLGIFRWFL